MADEVKCLVAAGALPAGLRRAVLLGNNGVHDLLPGERCQRGVAVLQIDLRDLQVHADMKHGFILGVNESLRLGLVADAKALALVEVDVETIVRVADSAIN